jgi:hypothetical protein
MTSQVGSIESVDTTLRLAVGLSLQGPTYGPIAQSNLVMTRASIGHLQPFLVPSR